MPRLPIILRYHLAPWPIAPHCMSDSSIELCLMTPLHPSTHGMCPKIGEKARNLFLSNTRHPLTENSCSVHFDENQWWLSKCCAVAHALSSSPNVVALWCKRATPASMCVNAAIPPTPAAFEKVWDCNTISGACALQPICGTQNKSNQTYRVGMAASSFFIDSCHSAGILGILQNPPRHLFSL